MAVRLLVVEDEPFIGMNLVDLAEDLGFEVAGPAASAQSALMVAADQPPDVAIIDVNLVDGPTGPLVAAQLAKAFGTQVLVLTATRSWWQTVSVALRWCLPSPSTLPKYRRRLKGFINVEAQLPLCDLIEHAGSAAVALASAPLWRLGRRA